MSIKQDTRNEHTAALLRLFALFAPETARDNAIKAIRAGVETAADLDALDVALRQVEAYTHNGQQRAVAQSLQQTLSHYRALPTTRTPCSPDTRPPP